MNFLKILLADYNVAGLAGVSPYSGCWSSRVVKCWILQVFWAISAECCSCTVGVWKWHDSLKCVMKCFWVGRRWKAAALSSAGDLPLAIALPAPSAQFLKDWYNCSIKCIGGVNSACAGALCTCYFRNDLTLFCGVSATSYSLPKKVTADCKHLPIQCFTEAVDLYSFTFSALLQWGSCWFLLWYLEGVKSIILPFGHSYIICMVITFSKWSSMSPEKSSVTVWAVFSGL